jgi:hypothetical protein
MLARKGKTRKMTKIEDLLTEEQVDLHRFENCKKYDDCLSQAAKMRWRSFSCMGCKSYVDGGTELLDLGFMDTDDIYDAHIYGVGKQSSLFRGLRESAERQGIKQFDSMHRVVKAKKAV